MSKHTPGPWEACWHFTPKAPTATRVICNLTHSNFCEVVKAAGNEEAIASDADAYLIAAAPELLEELRDRYNMTKCGCGHWACTRCRDDEMTLAVIRKAQGETG